MKTERIAGTYQLQINLAGQGYDHTEGTYPTLEAGLVALKNSYEVNKRFTPDAGEVHARVELVKIMEDEEDETIAGYDTERATEREDRNPRWDDDKCVTVDQECYKWGF